MRKSICVVVLLANIVCLCLSIGRGNLPAILGWIAALSGWSCALSVRTFDRKGDFYWHIHHDILLEQCYNYQERLDFIKSHKPKDEQELRIKLFQPVKGKLPLKLIKAMKVYDRAGKAYDEIWEVYYKARRAYIEAWKVGDEDKKVCGAALKSYIKVKKAYDKARKTYIKVCKACDIETLHKRECPNCPWDGKTIFPSCGKGI